MQLSTKVAIVLVFLVGIIAQSSALSPTAVARSGAELGPPAYSVSSLHLTASNAWQAAAVVTLPPEEKPKTHWPWWLRILAVIGVLLFIRIVAGSVRNNPNPPNQT